MEEDKRMVIFISQENRCKIVNRWHLKPKLLAKINAQVSDGCWRCGQGRADLFHMR